MSEDRCGHCTRRLIGFAAFDGVLVCHPDDPQLKDCYELVQRGHPMPCQCTASGKEAVDRRRAAMSLYQDVSLEGLGRWLRLHNPDLAPGLDEEELGRRTLQTFGPLREEPEPVQAWRVEEHYGLHVYECERLDGRPSDDDRPVATFHREEDARLVVDLVNSARGLVSRTSDTTRE